MRLQKSDFRLLIQLGDWAAINLKSEI